MPRREVCKEGEESCDEQFLAINAVFNGMMGLSSLAMLPIGLMSPGATC